MLHIGRVGDGEIVYSRVDPCGQPWGSGVGNFPCECPNYLEIPET